MRPRSSDRTGILIVRVWLEGDAGTGFRARITQTLDSRGPEQATSATALPEGVYAAVRTWLEAFVDHAPTPTPDRSAGDAAGPVTLA